MTPVEPTVFVLDDDPAVLDALSHLLQVMNLPAGIGHEETGVILVDHGSRRAESNNMLLETCKKILITTIYQVCKNDIPQAGARQAYTQQWHLLRQSGQTDPHPGHCDRH